MTRSMSLLLALVFVLTTAVGVLVRQQIQRSKFEKYLQPTNVTSMQLGVLEANLELVRDSVPSSTVPGIGIPDDGLRAVMSLLRRHGHRVR